MAALSTGVATMSSLAQLCMSPRSRDSVRCEADQSRAEMPEVSSCSWHPHSS